MMHSPFSILMLCIGALAAPATAQLQVEQARVIFVRDPLVQIDLGKETGLGPGDTVWFHPLGASDVRGVVKSVQQRTAWVTLSGTAAGVLIGTSADVTLSRRPQKPAPSANLRNPNRDLPSAPPTWTSGEKDWDPNRPLLQDIPYEKKSAPVEWGGRVYSILDTIHERDPRSSSSTFARFGASLNGVNPFGHNGQLIIDFDLDARSYNAADSGPGAGAGGPYDRDTFFRLERLAYSRGGGREQPLRWQVGRFLTTEFPEFGVIDGVEVTYRLHDGDRVGASFGYMPEPGQDYATGKDLQISTGYRGFIGEQQQLSWGAGLQKSWHRGAPDRDLAVLRADYYASSEFTWHNSAWIDFYSSSDQQKSSSAELSTWTSIANWHQQQHGSTLSLRHWRFPELLRFQSGLFINDDLSDARTTRVDASHWQRLSPRLRIRGSADVWKSESRDGVGADIRFDLASTFGAGTNSWLTFYFLEASDHQAGGIRLGQVIPLSRGSLRLWWDSARYRPLDDEGSLTQHDVRLAWDYWSQSKWSSTVDLGRRFGDEQDSYSLGLYLQRTF
jgi:hypothetical protein